MRTVQQIYKNTKSVQNYSDGFKVNADILQSLMDQLTGNGRNNFQGNNDLYDMPAGNLTNGFDPVTFNGAMATAQGAAGITQVGGYDRIVVANGGVNTDSWFRTAKIFSAKPLFAHMRVKVAAVGAAPVLGFRTISPGATYTNSGSQLRTFVINLITGAITVNSSTGYTVSQTNQFSGAIVAGEIVDVYLQWLYRGYWSITIVRNDANSQTSVFKMLLTDPTNNASLELNMWYLCPILFDGTYQLMNFDVKTANNYNSTVGLLGDSMLTAASIAYADTIQGKLSSALAQRVANFAGGGMLLPGIQSVLKDLLASNTQVCFLCNALDGIFGGKANPANGGYAAWSASFNSVVNTLISLGIEPVMFAPSCTAIYTEAAKQFMIDYWVSQFPGRQYVTTVPSEVILDNSTIHYSPYTNQIVTDRLVAILETLGKI
jgi:hypothetical protein